MYGAVGPSILLHQGTLHMRFNGDALKFLSKLGFFVAKFNKDVLVRYYSIIKKLLFC